MLSSLFTVGCRDKSQPKPKEETPAFVDIAVDALNEIRKTQGDKAAINYVDSIRKLYINKSLAYKYYIYYVYADTYERIGDQEKVRKYCDSIINLLEGYDPSNFWFNNYIWAYFFKAKVELKEGNLDLAYKYYYKALSLAEEHNDRCAIGTYYLKMGYNIYSTEQYTGAASYFKRAYEESESCDDNFGTYLRQQQTLNCIGLCYEKAQMLDSAVHFYKECLSYINTNYKKHKTKTHWLADVAAAVVKGNLAGVLAKQGHITGVEQMLKESIAINEKKGNDLLDAQYTRIKLSDFYIQHNRLTEAKDLLDLVKKIDDTLSNDNVEVRWNKVMSRYYDLKNDIPNAYKHFRAYHLGVDSIHKSRAYFSLANIDNNVKDIGKEYKIFNLEHAADLRKVYLIIAIVISLLAIVIATLVIRNARRTKKHVKTLQVMNQQINDQKLKMKKAFDDLETADTEKDRILKAVSHDMRSPVNSVLALIDLLKSDTSNLSEEQLEYIGLMEKSGENALNLTKDLLEVATLTATTLEKGPVDITTEIEARVRLLQFKASEKKQRIILDTPAIHITANVNAEKLLRVVSNLVGNAIKFSPESSEINLSLSANNSFFRIEVKDNGIGIPEIMKAKVFDIFSDAKRFGTSGEQPYGLGLSISKQIVEAHNGKIWLESDEGNGTTFFVEIPI